MRTWQLALLGRHHRNAMRVFFRTKAKLLRAMESAKVFIELNNKRVERLETERQDLLDTNTMIENNVLLMTESIQKINHLIGE